MDGNTSTYLYRIMPFKHVAGLFETRELHFASPESWDDPYERILQHRGSASIFAQCWCKRAVSDAMWRIYSNDRTAVRVRTCRAKLEAVGPRLQASYHAKFRVEDVTYGAPKHIDGELDRIVSGLRARFDMKRATDALFLKRDAFDFESEVRAVAYLQPPANGHTHLRIRVEPHDLIESILFDPRADETYVKMASHYLRKVLHFTGNVGRSTLYRPCAIRIPDEP